MPVYRHPLTKPVLSGFLWTTEATVDNRPEGEAAQRNRAPHRGGRPGSGYSGRRHFLPNLTFIEVPFSDSTLIVVPVFGSRMPALGCSSYQYFFVSSNSGTAFWPRT